MILASLALTVAAQLAPNQGAADVDLEPALAAHLETLPPEDEVSFLVILEERLPGATLLTETNGLRRDARAPYVRQRLERFSATSQAALDAELDRLRAAGQVSFDHTLWIVNARWVVGTAEALHTLASFDGVERVHWDRPLPAEALQDHRWSGRLPVWPVMLAPAVSAFLSGPPGPARAAAGEANIIGLQADQLWNVGIEGGGVLILNIDSGVNFNHPDIASTQWANPGEIPGNGVDDDGNGFIDDVWGWDFENGDNDPKDGGHGQNVAGILVGDGTNNGGVRTGMAPLATMAVAQVNGEANLLAAYQYAITIGADCVSSSHTMKWPFTPDYHTFRRAMESELAAGIAHANSIGNEGQSTLSYPLPYNIGTPGNCPGPWAHPAQVDAGRGSVLGVGGILLGGDALYVTGSQGPAGWEDITLLKPSYPYAQDPALWDYPYAGGTAPGLLKPDLTAYTIVTTTTGGSGYTTGFAGTSASTPHVGGSLLLLLDANQSALPRQLSQALQETAVDLGAPGKDVLYGAGKVQVYDAALRVLGLVTALPNDPAPGSTVNVELTGPLGDPFVLGVGFAPGTTPTSLGFALEMAPPVFPLVAGLLTGDASPLVFPVPVPNDPLLSGLTVYLQMVTDDTSGVTGQWLLSLLEPITIQ
jgi:hypothetical protein